MHTELNTLIETIKDDYKNWQNDCYLADTDQDGKTEIRNNMIREFNESIEVNPGKKYIKIVIKKSVWGFIVNVDNDKKFRKGDILKPAGWATPARNAARGNIIDGGYKIAWTGPHYL